MEDISRELEREIALAKPKPYKKDRTARVIIIDDFGQIKSGEYLKTLVKILFGISVICFVAAGLFYYLYTGLSRNSADYKTRLAVAEKKVDTLDQEREMLMARLVILGEEPEKNTELTAENKIPSSEIEEKKPLVSKKPYTKPISPETKEENPDPDDEPLVAEQQISNMEDPVSGGTDDLAEADMPITAGKVIKKTVSIEKFTVVKDGSNGDLLVRFDIRNISSDPGDVSGRIFTLLKPGNDQEDHWLVVPTSGLKNGIPSEYKKGQYFSIAHFKPVKFRIKNQEDPDFFKKASIFIFNNQGDLIFEKLIDITEAE